MRKRQPWGACLGLAAAIVVVAGPAASHPGVHEGIAEVTRQLETAPGASEFLERAELHRIAGEFDEAALDLARAAALNPRHPDLALCLAALSFDRGCLDEAESKLNRHLVVSPRDTRALLLRARVLSRQGRPLEAARDLGRALQDSPPASPDLYVEQATLLIAGGPGRLPDALAAIQLGLHRLGSIPSLELAALELEEAHGDVGAAIDRLDRLAERMPGRPGIWLARRARLLAREGDDEGARWAEAASMAAAERGPVAAEAIPAVPAAVVPRAGAAAPARTALAVVRGPYLLMGGHDRIAIRWRTDASSTGRVRFGTSLGSLTSTADDPAASTEHEVNLTGLAPDTRYYYSVGTGTLPLAGGDANHTFVTAPIPGTPKPTRIWVIGDSGSGASGAMAVRDAFASYSAARPADLWLMLGDNAYSGGTDAQYQAAVFDIYPSLLRTTALWPTRGNHDQLYSGANNDYYDLFTLPTGGEVGGLPSGTEAYYSFDRANVHFICLDSEGSDRSVGGPMAVWLRADLAATPRDWVIAFWHHPTYSKGSHDSDNDLDSGGRMRDMRQNILPILDSTGVDLVLFGHSHSYERSFLLDRHYGVSTTLTSAMKVDPGDGRWNGDGAYVKATLGTGPHEGCVYTVAGVGSQVGGGSLDHPVMITSLGVLGSLVIDVAGSRLDSRFLDSQGAVRDSFTIVKGSAVGVPPAGAALESELRILGAHPARGSVRFGCRLESPQRFRLILLDAVGRRVRALPAQVGAGDQVLTWDGRDDRGALCPPGVYFAVLEAGSKISSRKLVRLGP